MPDSEIAHSTILARGKTNGRHTLLTLVVALVFFFSSINAALQTRHQWPIIVADIGYVVAVSIVTFAYVRIYHTRRS